jgi:hypothetical protein
MAAVWCWACSRRRWAALWLALLAGVAAGAAMCAVAGWSRTRSALPAFERFSPPADAAVSADTASPAQAAVLERVAREAGATASLMVADVPLVIYQPDGTALTTSAVAAPYPAKGTVDRPLVVSGQLPDPARSDALIVNERAAADLHLHPGSVVHVGLYDSSQQGGPGSGPPTPRLGHVSMTVTAVVRYTADLERQPDDQPGTAFAAADYRISLSDGFWAKYGSRTATEFLGMAVRLPDGAKSFDRLAAVAAQLSQGRFTASLGDNFVPNRPALVRAINLQAGALLAVGVLGAIAAAVLLGQAILRQVALRTGDHRVLIGLGMTKPQIVGSEVLAMTPVAIGAAVVAVVVAVALSPLAPVGIARQAELHPGIDVNLIVMGAGVAAVVAFVVSVTAVAAWPRGRAGAARQTRRPVLPSRLAAAGAPAPVVVGTDLALSPMGRNRAFVRPALVALTVGVVAVVGAWVVRASLTDLLDTPAHRGWAWDAEVGDITSADAAAAGASALQHDPDVAGYAGEFGGVFLPIDGHPTPVSVLDSHGAVATPIVLHGRAPVAADEIGVGPSTLQALHKRVGDQVNIEAPNGTTIQAHIVGTVVPLSSVEALQSFGRGAIVPFATAKAAGPDQPKAPDSYLVTFRPGVDRPAAMARLESLFPRTVLVAPSSVDVDTLRRVDWLPIVLAVLIGALTIGMLAHLVLTSVPRRRREIGVLRALGFTKAQTVGAVLCMAALMAVVILGIGVPLGIVAGRVVWSAIADNLGAVAGAQVPGWLIVVVPCTLATALLASLWPAWRAVSRVPARALRTE